MIYLYNNKVVNFNEIWDNYIREININPFKTESYEEKFEREERENKEKLEKLSWK